MGVRQSRQHEHAGGSAPRRRGLSASRHWDVGRRGPEGRLVGPLGRDPDHETGRDERQQPRGDERALVVAEPGPGGAGAPGGDRGAELVRTEDPAEHDTDALPPERARR